MKIKKKEVIYQDKSYKCLLKQLIEKAKIQSYLIIITKNKQIKINKILIIIKLILINKKNIYLKYYILMIKVNFSLFRIKIFIYQAKIICKRK